jgi:hypothetical protein
MVHRDETGFLLQRVSYDLLEERTDNKTYVPFVGIISIVRLAFVCCRTFYVEYPSRSPYAHLSIILPHYLLNLMHRPPDTSSVYNN